MLITDHDNYFENISKTYMFAVCLEHEDDYHDEDQDNDDNPDGITFRLSMQRGIGAHGQQTEKHIYIYIC